MTVPAATLDLDTPAVPYVRPPMLEMPDSLADCERLRVELDTKVIELSNKLDTVRHRAVVEKVYADTGWFCRATAKLRYLRHDQQRLLRHVATLHKAERLAQHSVDLVLLRTLREQLGEDAYQARCAQALALLLAPV